MIKIYSPQEVNMDKVDKRDTAVFWDYPLSELEDLLDNKDDEMFVLYGDRLVEITEDFLDEWNDDYDSPNSWDEESNWYQQDIIDLYRYEK